MKWVYKVIPFEAGNRKFCDSQLSVCMKAPIDADCSYRNEMLSLESASVSLEEEHCTTTNHDTPSNCCSCARCRFEKTIQSQEIGVELRNIPEKLMEIAYLHQKLGNYDLALNSSKRLLPVSNRLSR